MKFMSAGVGVCARLAGVLCLAASSLLHSANQSSDAAQARLAELTAAVRQAEGANDFARAQELYTDIARLRPDDPVVQRGLGLTAYLQGKYEEAIPALEKALNLQSGLPGAGLYLGISYYRTNRFSEALQALEKAPESGANDPQARYWQGAAYRALNRLPAAITALEAARDGSASDLEVLYLLTRSYADYSSELFRRLLAVAPNSASGRLLKAEELAIDGAAQAALEELDAALEVKPGLFGLHLMKGQVLWTKEKYGEGAEEFRRELRNDPLNSEAHFRLGVFHLDSGDPVAALAHLRAAARHQPDDSRISEFLAKAEQAAGDESSQAVFSPSESFPRETRQADARAAYRRGELSVAAKELRDSLAERPDAVEARRLLARCYLAQGRGDQAIEQLQTVLTQTRDDPESLYVLGKTYEQRAAQTAERLFELHPNSYRVRLLRGESLERGPRYEFEKALSEFRKAEELSPQAPGVHYALGRVMFKMNRFDEAIAHLRKELAQSPGHATASYLLGKIFLSRADNEEATKHLQKAVEAQPNLAGAQRDLARALVSGGRHEDGIKIYERLAESHSGDSSLQALLAVAYRSAGRIDEAKQAAEKARQLGAAKHQPQSP